jgi:hypothetical protein
MESMQLQNAVHDLRPTTVGFSNRGGVAFYSILKATEKVPYDSAILLFTGRAAEDEDLALITSENLASKRCKVSSERNYMTWENPSKNGVRLHVVSFKVQTRLHFAQDRVQFTARVNSKLAGLKIGVGGRCLTS